MSADDWSTTFAYLHVNLVVCGQSVPRVQVQDGEQPPVLVSTSKQSLSDGVLILGLWDGILVVVRDGVSEMPAVRFDLTK